MREPAWMVKYQAREALKHGRPEEAHRLLEGLVAAGDRKSWALRGDVIRGYVERAERALAERRRRGRLERPDASNAAGHARRSGCHATARSAGAAGAGRDPGDARSRQTARSPGSDRPVARTARRFAGPIRHSKKRLATGRRPSTTPIAASSNKPARPWPSVRPQIGTRTTGLDRYEEQLNVRDDRFRSGLAVLARSGCRDPTGEKCSAAPTKCWPSRRDIAKHSRPAIAPGKCFNRKPSSRRRALGHGRHSSRPEPAPSRTAAAAEAILPVDRRRRRLSRLPRQSHLDRPGHRRRPGRCAALRRRVAHPCRPDARRRVLPARSEQGGLAERRTSPRKPCCRTATASRSATRAR